MPMSISHVREATPVHQNNPCTLSAYTPVHQNSKHPCTCLRRRRRHHRAQPAADAEAIHPQINRCPLATLMRSSPDHTPWAPVHRRCRPNSEPPSRLLLPSSSISALRRHSTPSYRVLDFSNSAKKFPHISAVCRTANFLNLELTARELRSTTDQPKSA